MKRTLGQIALLLPLCCCFACSDDSASPPQGDGAVGQDRGPGTDGTSPSAVCPVQAFAPCGGELDGTWRFLSFCPEDQAAADALFEHPYDNLEACKDREANTVVGIATTEGTMRFESGNVTIVTSGKIEVTYGFTDACLAAAVSPNSDPQTACLSMAKPERLTCRYEASKCTCSATLPGAEENTTVSYQLLDATTLKLEGGETARFCQQDPLLTLDWMPHPISWRYWILERQ